MITDTRTDPHQHMRSPKNRRIILCRFEYLPKPVVDCNGVTVLKDRRIMDRRES